MNIQLKNVKYSAFASRETHCFQASIYIDGKKVGTVENEGYGGPDSFHPSTVADQINEYAKNLPPIQFEGMTMAQNAETVIGELMNKYLQGKQLNSLLSSRLVYVKNRPCSLCCVRQDKAETKCSGHLECFVV